MKLRTAVRRALNDRSLEGFDNGAAELALTYARRIDDGEPVEKLGPLLLAALESLGMTPRARSAMMKGVTAGDSAAATPLDKYRRRHAQRRHGAPPVDPAPEGADP